MKMLPITYLKYTSKKPVLIPIALQQILPTLPPRHQFSTYFDLYQYCLYQWQQQRDSFVWPAQTQTIPILMLLHNNEAYCQTLLPVMLNVFQKELGHQGYRCQFFFYENNSTDQTAALLQQLALTYPIAVCSEQLDCDFKDFQGCNLARSSVRCRHLARLRNALLGMALPAIVRAPFLFLLDTNIYCSQSTVTQLVATLQQQSNIGMVTACTMQLDHPSHYYDTYAYTDLQERATNSITRYTCALANCPHCQKKKRRMPLFSFNTAAWPVASAFAGVAALNPLATLTGAWYSDNNLCEHVYYCAKLREAGYQIFLVPSAQAIWAPHFDLSTQQQIVRLIAKTKK